MNKKRIRIIIIVFIIILGIISIIVFINKLSSILGFIISMCLLLISIFSLFIPTTFTYNFFESNWAKDEHGFYLLIPKIKHGLGNNPIIQVLLLNNDNIYEKVECEEKCSKGEVKISASRPFNGKIILYN